MKRKVMFTETIVREYRLLIPDALDAGEFLQHVRDCNGHGMLERTSILGPGHCSLYVLTVNNPAEDFDPYLRGLLAVIGGKIDVVEVEA